MESPRPRSRYLAALVVWTGITLMTGCDRSVNDGKAENIWGVRGTADGLLQKPRAMAIDEEDRIYVVDMSARIQVFDTDGNLLKGPWRTPDFANGKPTGISIDRNGNLLVADTHYYRVLFYTPDGKLLEEKTIGGVGGQAAGEFGLVTDVVQDSRGYYYVSEYGQYDRIQKFSPQGAFVKQWGGHGDAPGQFRRPQNMAIDDQDRIWVADACNHRIQVFDTDGILLEIWGTFGREIGQLSYPYDLVLDNDYLYVCEFGNNRVQKFTHDGRSIATWGESGRRNGQLHNPWALVRDSGGRLFVLDTNNHRVQQLRM